MTKYQKKITKMYVDEVKSINQIARAVGKPYATVRSQLLRAGVTLRPRGGGHPQHKSVTDTDNRRMKSLYVDAKMTLAEIGEIEGVCGASIRSRLIRAGIPRRTHSEAMALSYQRNRDKRPRGWREDAPVID